MMMGDTTNCASRQRTTVQETSKIKSAIAQETSSKSPRGFPLRYLATALSITNGETKGQSSPPFSTKVASRLLKCHKSQKRASRLFKKSARDVSEKRIRTKRLVAKIIFQDNVVRRDARGHFWRETNK